MNEKKKKENNIYTTGETITFKDLSRSHRPKIWSLTWNTVLAKILTIKEKLKKRKIIKWFQKHGVRPVSFVITRSEERKKNMTHQISNTF